MSLALQVIGMCLRGAKPVMTLFCYCSRETPLGIVRPICHWPQCTEYYMQHALLALATSRAPALWVIRAGRAVVYNIDRTCRMIPLSIMPWIRTRSSRNTGRSKVSLTC